MKPSLPRLALALLLVLPSTGCSYHGEIRHDFYQPQAAKKKLPFKVAVVTDKKFIVETYKWDDVAPSTLELQPGLDNALVGQMSMLFDHVTVLKDTATVSGLDFLIYPSLIKDDPGSLKIVIEDAVSRKALATYANSTQIVALWPVFNCALPETLSIFSACLLCPITIPWSIKGNSQSMRSTVEAAITKNISEIAKRIQADGPLLAARGSPVLPPAPGGKTP